MAISGVTALAVKWVTSVNLASLCLFSHCRKVSMDMAPLSDFQISVTGCLKKDFLSLVSLRLGFNSLHPCEKVHGVRNLTNDA